MTYGDLLEAADPSSPIWSRRASGGAPERGGAAMRRLRETLSAARLDALVVMGDDQNESYREDCRPAFAIYSWRHDPQRQRPAPDLFALPGLVCAEPQGLLRARARARLSGSCRACGSPDRVTMDMGFDLAARRRLPEGEGEGHAIAYVHRQVMDLAKSHTGGADLPQHLLSSEPAAAEPLLPVRAGAAHSARGLCGRGADRHPGVRWLEPFPGG